MEIDRGVVTIKTGDWDWKTEFLQLEAVDGTP
jgi:hypothetical protein